MRKEYLEYMFLALCIISVFASIITLNIYLILLTALFSLTAIIIVKGWEIIEVEIFKHTNLIQLFQGYELGGLRDCAIRKTRNGYIATAVSLLDVKRGVPLETKTIENIISHLNFPFKFVLQIKKVELKKMLDSMQTKRNIKEIELSKINKEKHQDRANKLRREIEQMEADLNSIRSSEVPVMAAHYLFTSAFSENAFSASELAKLQISSLSSEFDAALSSSSSILSGNELLNILNLDSAIGFEC